MEKITRRNFLSATGALGAAGLLAGCNDSSVDNTTTTSSTSSSSNASASASGLELSDGLPIVDETVTLNFLVKSTSTIATFAENTWTKKYEDMTGVHIEWTEIASSVYDEKKNLILVAGTSLPDAFFKEGLSNVDMAMYAEQGYFMPLDDLIAEYGANLSALFESNPELKAVSTLADGKIYSLPYVSEPYEHQRVSKFMFVNPTWLAAVGKSAPSTADELLDVLRAFRDGKPNSTDEDVIPFVALKEDSYQLFAAFGRPENEDHYVVEDKKVVFTADKEEWKDAVNYLHQLYEEKLLDQEFLTQDTDAYNAKVRGGDSVGFLFNYSETNLSDRSADFELLKPLKCADGKQIYGVANAIGPVPHVFTITKANAYPELTMRWVDQLYNPMTSIESIYGTFGETQYEKEDGLWATDFTDKTDQGLTATQVRDANSFQTNSPGAILDEYLNTLIVPLPGPQRRVEIVAEYYQDYIYPDFYPIVNYTVEDSEYILQAEGEINGYVNEMYAKWVVKGGIDDEWEEYQSTLASMKVDEYIAKLQEYYDANLKIMGE